MEPENQNKQNKTETASQIQETVGYQSGKTVEGRQNTLRGLRGANFWGGGENS